MNALLHPTLAATVYKQRQAELESFAASQRAARETRTSNIVDRFFVKRREGKVTWIDTVLVHRSA